MDERERRKKIREYWEEQRKIAQEIKDEYDHEMDEKYHRDFYNKFIRPDILIHSEYKPEVMQQVIARD